MGLGRQGRASGTGRDGAGWEGGSMPQHPPPLHKDHLHGVDCDGECGVIPIHLSLLGSLGLLGEALVGDPDPVHAHGHNKH